MKKYIPKNLLFILPILLIFGGYLIFSDNSPLLSGLGARGEGIVSVSGPNVRFAKSAVAVMVADEPNEQWQGLSDRKSLGPNNGMLFVFPDYQPRTFVMRRMHFPLDIIWIKDNKIVGIAKNLPPEGENPTEFYKSPKSVNYVLEVNGGYCDAFGIEVGDEVEFSIFNF